MTKAFAIFILLTILVASSFSQVGIGTTTPDTTAQLDVSAVNNGILIPRITPAAIAASATAYLFFKQAVLQGFITMPVWHVSNRLLTQCFQ